MRTSKDLAKRLRFDRFPGRDFVRRYYLVAGIAAALLGVGTWVAFTRCFGTRQYLPGPVSQSHASFGDQCERCHQAFTRVQNTACLQCHEPRTHSALEVHTPRCGACHTEHRGVQVFLSVNNAMCVDCHGALQTNGPPSAVQPVIRSFAEHPELSPLQLPRRDAAAIRFNHQLHLISAEVAKTENLQCASCHVVESTGTMMRPVAFETHCKRCHKQEVQGPIDSIEALHTTPETVRADLIKQLLVVGVQNPDQIFGAPGFIVPGKFRGPIDESRSLRQYQERWLEMIETALYRPFNPAPPLLEHNKYCLLCHVSVSDRAAGELAVLEPSAIPRRWLAHAEFSHRRHDLLPCRDCHEQVETSQLTSDTNLPSRHVCLRCHVDGVLQSAGTDCMLCHLYHDVSKAPALKAARRREVPSEQLSNGGAGDWTALLRRNVFP